MLRVGLTGELGSGKTTFGRMLGQRGAVVLSSDEIARHMMQPAEPVYRAIVDHFGRGVLLPGGSLNRKMLADLAFDPNRPRVDELNAIVHPPVIEEQERRIARIERDSPGRHRHHRIGADLHNEVRRRRSLAIPVRPRHSGDRA